MSASIDVYDLPHLKSYCDFVLRLNHFGCAFGIDDLEKVTATIYRYLAQIILKQANLLSKVLISQANGRWQQITFIVLSILGTMEVIRTLVM